MRLLLAFFLACFLPTSVTAFVPLKGESARSRTPAHRPPTARQQGATTLHAVAKKKKSAASAKKKKAPAKKTPVETVNKSELVRQMADQCGLTKMDTELALNAFLEVVQQNVAEGKKITLVGFGSFSLKERAARKGRNPQTGEELDIPASKAPGFSAGKAWKDRVNGK